MSNDKLKTFLTEEKRKLKPSLHKLDDKIEKFIEQIEKQIDAVIEQIEKQIDAVEENPVFQRKVNQLLVDLSKEHGEFILALRAIVAALDRGAQMVPMRKPEFMARGVNQEEPVEDPQEEKKDEENN